MGAGAGEMQGDRNPLPRSTATLSRAMPSSASRPGWRNGDAGIGLDRQLQDAVIAFAEALDQRRSGDGFRLNAPKMVWPRSKMARGPPKPSLREERRGQPLRAAMPIWNGRAFSVGSLSHAIRPEAWHRGQAERALDRVRGQLEQVGRRRRRPERAADRRGMESEIVLLHRPQRHRHAIFDLAAERDRAQQIGAGGVDMLGDCERGRQDGGDRVKNGLGMERLDVARIAERAVRQRSTDRIGPDPAPDEAGRPLPALPLAELSDQGSGRKRRDPWRSRIAAVPSRTTSTVLARTASGKRLGEKLLTQPANASVNVPEEVSDAIEFAPDQPA